MDGYVNVIERKNGNLIKIDSRKKSRGFGVLFLNFTEEKIILIAFIKQLLLQIK